MKKPSKLWRIAGLVFAVINVAGGAYAAALGEWMHAVVHVGLLSVGFLAWEIFFGKREVEPDTVSIDESRLDSLQESVDSIALNVERVGEDQRYQEKVLKKRVERSPE